MSTRLPRWYRHRCPHDNRVVKQVASGRIISDYCPDCGARFPADTFLAKLVVEREAHRATGCRVFDEPLARCTCPVSSGVDQ